MGASGKMRMSILAFLGVSLAVAAAFPAPEQLASVEGQAPAVFTAELQTQAPSGKIVVEMHRDWAPKGVDRFYQLVKSGFFNNARVFRVVPNFVVQFGINGDPNIQQNYRGPSANIMDDPVKKQNLAGTVSFATSGPNTRSTQLFINLEDNLNLDSMGFAPIGKVITGMPHVKNFFAGYGEQPDQNAIQMQGNAYLNKEFPKLTYFTGFKVSPVAASETQATQDRPWN